MGQVVQARRKKRKLSQEAFARECGLHRTFMSLLERGQRLPSLESIEKLAQGLNMRTYELVREVERRVP